MTITFTAIKEKIRQKELYIVTAIGILIVLLFGSGSGTISVNGEVVEDFDMLALVLFTVVNAVGCILAAFMSACTIPNEYERNTSHLIWIRKVPQWCYHGELALANVATGLVSEVILFCSIIFFMFNQGRADELIRLIPTFYIAGVNIAIVSFMTSALSIVVPKLFSGVIAMAFTLFGIFYGLIELFKDSLNGIGGKIVKVLLKVVPDLNGVQREAVDFLCGNEVDEKVILTGMLWACGFVVCILVLKRREARL